MCTSSHFKLFLLRKTCTVFTTAVSFPSKIQSGTQQQNRARRYFVMQFQQVNC